MQFFLKCSNGLAPPHAHSPAFSWPWWQWVFYVFVLDSDLPFALSLELTVLRLWSVSSLCELPLALHSLALPSCHLVEPSVQEEGTLGLPCPQSWFGQQLSARVW